MAELPDAGGAEPDAACPDLRQVLDQELDRLLRTPAGRRFLSVGRPDACSKRPVSWSSSETTVADRLNRAEATLKTRLPPRRGLAPAPVSAGLLETGGSVTAVPHPSRGFDGSRNFQPGDWQAGDEQRQKLTPDPEDGRDRDPTGGRVFSVGGRWVRGKPWPPGQPPALGSRNKRGGFAICHFGRSARHPSRPAPRPSRTPPWPRSVLSGSDPLGSGAARLLAVPPRPSIVGVRPRAAGSRPLGPIYWKAGPR